MVALFDRAVLSKFRRNYDLSHSYLLHRPSGAGCCG